MESMRCFPNIPALQSHSICSELKKENFCLYRVKNPENGVFWYLFSMWWPGSTLQNESHCTLWWVDSRGLILLLPLLSASFHFDTQARSSPTFSFGATATRPALGFSVNLLIPLSVVNSHTALFRATDVQSTLSPICEFGHPPPFNA